MNSASDTLLQFGIPTVDGLFQIPNIDSAYSGTRLLNPKLDDAGILVPADTSTSIAISGPEGTGKSVFALHLASRYFAQCRKAGSRASVFYVSTDLNFEMALQMWKNFRLDEPKFDRDPFAEGSGVADAASQKLAQLSPEKLCENPRHLQDKGVGFIDLAANTAGDDWAFLTRFISALERVDRPHLLIIDAVEGFETYVGDLDAYGENTSRRARVAQIMRMVNQKCHVMFVIEDSHDDLKRPEQFVTDVVIRLRKANAHGYVRRTFEIEKVRGQSFTRGSHHYTIRSGDAATSGPQENADDPSFPRRGQGVALGRRRYSQSYVYLLHSLHHFNRMVMKRRGQGPPPLPSHSFNSFGIEYLDNMLSGTVETERRSGFDIRGIPAGTITALIGDSFTQKSRLGIAYLSQAFSPVTRILAEFDDFRADRSDFQSLANCLFRILGMRADQCDEDQYQRCGACLRDQDFGGLVQELRIIANEHGRGSATFDDRRAALLLGIEQRVKTSDDLIKWMIRAEAGVALMITTYDISVNELRNKFLKRLEVQNGRILRGAERRILREAIKDNTICRRLEIHDISSATMLNIFAKSILSGLDRLHLPLGGEFDPIAYGAGRVRLVVDDFSILHNLYSDFANDPLLLPTLKFLLGRLGISALIIDTQSGSPDITVAERFASELRQMADHRLYTWRVPFYGDSRVAIAAIPPFSPQYAGLIRELRWENSEEDPPIIDPHFELYKGLETGKPKPVGLSIRLFAELPKFQNYIDRENFLFNDHFALPDHIASTCANVIDGVAAEDYENFRNVCYLQRDTRLEHTEVVQVDEFWAARLPSRRRSGSFRPQWEYLNSETRRCGIPLPENDPYGHFQTRVSDRTERRHQFFDASLGYRFPDSEDEQRRIERVPFSWDFGFLLCRKKAWQAAYKKNLQSYSDATPRKVRAVWNALVKIPAESQRHRISAPVSWREFLDACRNVAEVDSDRRGELTPPFDGSFFTPEGFSCLLLEIWASEILKNLIPSQMEGFRKSLSVRNWSGTSESSLSRWLRSRDRGFRKELFRTWLLLVDVLDFDSIAASETSLEATFQRHVASPYAIASRHWYKSACQFVEDMDAIEPLVAVRLPGQFTVRGDWFLAVLGGSRSNRVADRALDILSSERSNLTRLHAGLGLPTRSFEKREALRSGLRLNGRFDQPQFVAYDEMRNISDLSDENFSSLWRSSLTGYHRHLNVWHRWLNSTMKWWVNLKAKHSSEWYGGFKVYDNFEAMLDDQIRKVWKEFNGLCDNLEAKLASASAESEG